MIYLNHGGLEKAFSKGDSTFDKIVNFRDLFTSYFTDTRTYKHVSNPAATSSAKRINMFLRWMVRKDEANIDFGIWNCIPVNELMIPLDIHTGNTARKLGLLKRKQNDWKAVVELTEKLQNFDKDDPVKYDYALFGSGVFDNGY